MDFKCFLPPVRKNTYIFLIYGDPMSVFSDYWNIDPVQVCSTSYNAVCHCHLKYILIQKWPKLTIFQNWVNLTSFETSCIYKFWQLQKCKLLNMKTNLVLTFVPWKYNFEVVLTRKEIMDKTYHFTHQNEWFFIF